MARINASINLTKLKEEIIKNPALIAFKSKKGDAYINATIWINSELDDYNNDCSIQLNAPKDVELPNKIYIGNGKTDSAYEEIKKREELANAKLKHQNKTNLDFVKTEDNNAAIEIPFVDDLPF